MDSRCVKRELDVYQKYYRYSYCRLIFDTNAALTDVTTAPIISKCVLVPVSSLSK